MYVVIIIFIIINTTIHHLIRSALCHSNKSLYSRVSLGRKRRTTVDKLLHVSNLLSSATAVLALTSTTSRPPPVTPTQVSPVHMLTPVPSERSSATVDELLRVKSHSALVFDHERGECNTNAPFLLFLLYFSKKRITASIDYLLINSPFSFPIVILDRWRGL